MRGTTTMITTDDTKVMLIQVPIAMERLSLSLAPKACETMIPAPTEIPTKSMRNRFRSGPALPTAASALSPTNFPTIMLSTVL